MAYYRLTWVGVNVPSFNSGSSNRESTGSGSIDMYSLPVLAAFEEFTNPPLLILARLPRFIFPGQVRHVIQSGNNRQTIFSSWKVTNFSETGWSLSAISINVLFVFIYSWRTMFICSSNLITSSIFRKWCRCWHVMSCNFSIMLTNGPARCWKGATKPVDRFRTYLLTCCRYIELNPVQTESGSVGLWINCAYNIPMWYSYEL